MEQSSDGRFRAVQLRRQLSQGPSLQMMQDDRFALILGQLRKPFANPSKSSIRIACWLGEGCPTIIQFSARQKESATPVSN
jgi:hypothetical protein